MNAIHIASTGLFVAMGQPSNRRYKAVRRFARRNDITFVRPERVYHELTVAGSDAQTPPVDTAIEEDWVSIVAPLEFSQSVVSRVMDGVQRYIATADDRPADEVERDPDRAQWLAERLQNTVVLEAEATDLDFLDREQVGRADVFIATLDNDQQNLLATLLANRLGAERTVAVVDTVAFSDLTVESTSGFLGVVVNIGLWP